MKEKGIHDHKVLPKAELNANNPYYKHSPRNYLELEPSNCAFFKDLSDRLYQHIFCRHNLPDNDPKNFILSVLKYLMSSYLHI